MVKKLQSALLCFFLLISICSCSATQQQTSLTGTIKTNSPEDTSPATAPPGTEKALVALSTMEKTEENNSITFTVHGLGTFGENNEYTVVDMAVKNDTKDAVNISHVYSLVAADDKGNSIEVSMDGIIALGLLYMKEGQNAGLIDSTIQPGSSHRGMVVYTTADAGQIKEFELTVILEKSLKKTVITIDLE
ncbi:MAG: hypothetical protein ACYCX2_10130 [Christensenellales bacterium]